MGHVEAFEFNLYCFRAAANDYFHYHYTRIMLILGVIPPPDFLMILTIILPDFFVP